MRLTRLATALALTGLFSAPRTPLGWKKVMAEEVGAGPQAANPQAPVQR